MIGLQTSRVFDTSWFARYQPLLLFYANTNYGRGVLGIDGKNSAVEKNKILAISPNAITWQNPDGTFSTEFRTHEKYGKRLFYSYKYFWEAFHWFDLNIANIYIPRLNVGFDSLTAYPAAGAVSPVDGYVGRKDIDETFATIRAGAGVDAVDNTATSNLCQLSASTTSNQFSQLYRNFFLFNTASISDTAIISSAVLSLYGYSGSGKVNALGGAPAYHVVASSPASSSALANSDYGNVSFTTFGNVTHANYDANAYNNITLNASGIANVSKTGVSKFGVISNSDLNNSFGGVWASAAQQYVGVYFADQAGTTNDPKFVVTYAPRNSATGRTLVSNRSVVSTRRAIRDFGTSLNLGTSGNSIVTTPNTIASTSLVTFSIWFNRNGDQGSNKVGRIMSFVAGGATMDLAITGTPSPLGWGVNILSLFNAGSNWQNTGYLVPLNKWIHIVVVRDGSTVKTYINGALQNSQAASGAMTGLVYLGNYSGANEGAKGLIDEPMFWSTNLTATEISDLYYKNIIPQTASLKGKWLLDEGSGTSATDSSGNSNTGTITTAIYSTDVVNKPRTLLT